MRIGDTIYLDYQASTPVDVRVQEVMASAQRDHFANPHSADHILGWRANAAISQAAETIASYCGLSGEDLVFTSGASEANAMAVAALVHHAEQSGRSRLLLGAGDHSSILHEARRTKLQTELIPLTPEGSPDVAWLEANLDDAVAGVSIIGVNNENGAITDLESISLLCDRYGILLHADLVQVPCAHDIDLLETSVALATLSSHKIYGPKGIGALLIAPEAAASIVPVIVGGGQQGGKRGGTLPTELCLGFAEAIRLLSEVRGGERLRIAALRDQFVSELEHRGLGRLLGPKAPRHPSNALMHFPGHEADDLLGRLQPYIAASSGSACTSGEVEASRVVRAMGADTETARETIRFSFGRFSDEQQAIEAVRALERELTSSDLNR